MPDNDRMTLECAQFDGLGEAVYPLIGARILCIFMLIDVTDGDNDYGRDPKGPQDY